MLLFFWVFVNGCIWFILPYYGFYRCMLRCPLRSTNQHINGLEKKNKEIYSLVKSKELSVICYRSQFLVQLTILTFTISSRIAIFVFGLNLITFRKWNNVKINIPQYSFTFVCYYITGTLIWWHAEVFEGFLLRYGTNNYIAFPIVFYWECTNMSTSLDINFHKFYVK